MLPETKKVKQFQMVGTDTIITLDLENNVLDNAIWYLLCAKDHQNFSDLPTNITRMELGLVELKKAIKIAEKRWEEI
jgi:hypothetical protein